MDGLMVRVLSAAMVEVMSVLVVVMGARKAIWVGGGGGWGGDWCGAGGLLS